jgi:hypothetical protein
MASSVISTRMIPTSRHFGMPHHLTPKQRYDPTIIDDWKCFEIGNFSKRKFERYEAHPSLSIDISSL